MDDRLLPALYYIQSNLDGDLSLERLSNVAGFSESHFHAEFKRHLHETPRDYVERVRLERAAFYLRVLEEPILQIALDTGYQSHETFVRAFQRVYEVSPSEYRDADLPWPSSSTSTSPYDDTYSLSKPIARNRKTLAIAFIRHIGPYELVPPTMWGEIEEFLKANSWPADGPRVGIGHDSPAVTNPNQLRFDAGIVVPDQVKGKGNIGVQTLQGGLAAVTTHVGPYSSLPRAYEEIYMRASKLDGYQLVGLPAVEIYQAQEIVDSNPIEFTDIYLPVRKASPK